MIDKGIENAAIAWEVKRRIRLPGLMAAAGSSALEQTLADIDGVLRVAAEPAKHWVEVTYLVTKTDYQSLERAAEMAGFPPAANRWVRLRSGWYQNLDLNGRANAKAPAPACCNKAPVKGH
jgi:hypothetical protein